MANKTWTNMSGDWNTGSLWSGGTVPGTADTAIFGGTLFYQAVIGLNGSTADTVANVTLTDAGATLQIDTGSSLAVAGVFSLLAGNLSLEGALRGGTLLGNGGSLEIGGDAYQGAGTLSHETIAGSVQAGGYYGTLDVTGGLAFQAGGVLSLAGGSGDEIVFLDGETLAGGTIVTQDYGDTLAATAGAVTFASGFTLDVDNATTLTDSFVNQGRIIIGSFATLALAPASFSNTGIIDLGPYAQIDLGSLTTAELTALAAGISNAGGYISVRGTLDNTGANLDLAGGALPAELELVQATVVGGTILASPTAALLKLGTLSGVTIDGTLSVPTVATIVNGVRLLGAGGIGPGGLAFGGNDSLVLLDSETLDSAVVSVAGRYNTISGSAALTLGSQLTLQVGRGNVAISAAALVNNGVIDITAGGTAALLFSGANFSNAGAINIAAGGVVEIGGSLTTAQLLADLAGIGNLGTIELVGTVVNTGAILALPGAVVLDGDIVGGTVVDGGSLTVAGGTLDGVTFQGPLNFTASYAQATISNGITLETASGAPGGAIDMGGTYGTLVLATAENLTAGTLLMTGGHDQVVALTPTLNIGSGFTVDATGFEAISATTIVNAGLITARAQGTEINLATSTLVNTGAVVIPAGATLDLGFSSFGFALGQALSVSGGGALALAPGAQLNLGGSETTAQLTALLGGDIGLAIGLSGTVTNTGTELGVGVAIASLAITADLIGGIVANPAGSVLVGSSTLDGVTFQGPLATGAAAATITVRNGLTLLNVAGGAGGIVSLDGSYQILSIADAETLDNAAITVAGSGDGIASATGTLTLGGNLSIAVGGGPGASAALTATRLVTGADMIVAGGATLDLATTTIVNSGSIGVAAGAALEIGVGARGSLALTDTGSIALAVGSTLALGGTVTTPQVLALLGAQTGVALELAGRLINTGATFAAGSGVLAEITLAGGAIVGGVVEGAGLAVTTGTLAGVTVRGPLTLQTQYSSLDITGGITLQTAAGAAGGTIVLAAANQDLAVLDSEVLNNATILVTGTQDLIGASTVLSLGTAAMIDVLGSATISAGTLVNNGSLVAGGPGGVLLIDSATITNGGIIAAGAGDVIGIGIGQYGDSLFQTLAINTGGLPHTGGGISPFGLTLTSGATLELGAIATTAQLSSLLGSATGVAVSLLGTLVNTGTSLVSIANGTLANLLLEADVIGGTIANRGGNVTVTGGTLDGVTFAGPLALGTTSTSNSFTTLNIRDGLRLLPATGTGLGTIDVAGHSTTLEFADQETLATVIVTAGTGAFNLLADTPVLTLGATATLALGGASTFTAATIVNAGTIATTGTAASVILAAGTILNSGTISVGADDTLAIDSTAFAGLGDGLDLVNSGRIGVAAGGTLVVGSTETTAQLLALVGSLAPAGVTIVVDGTLINTGAVLGIGGTGSLATVVLDADIIGGTMQATGTALSVAGGTFDGVAVQGPLNLTGADGTLAITDGTSFAAGPAGGAGAINANSFGGTLAILDATILDNVAVTIGTLASDFTIETATPTLTFGAAVTIEAAGAVTLGAGSAIVSGAQVSLAAGGLFQNGALDFEADTIFNSGTVIAPAGTEIGIDPDGPLTAGATLDLVDTGSFAIAPGASLAVGGAQTTAQLVALVDGISQGGVSLILDGSLDNTAAALTLAPGVFGDVTLNGTIAHGTIDAAGADIGFGRAQFQTVTVQGPLAIAGSSAYLGITGGLTVLSTVAGLPGSVSLSGSGDTIDFVGNQNFDAAAILASGRNDALAHGTLTLGTGVTLSVAGGLTDGSQYTASELINQGSISVTGALLLNDRTVVNTGVLNVVAYGVLGVALAPSSGPSLPFFNSGSVAMAAGSTILVGGAETDAQLLALLDGLSNPGVVVELDGSLTNTGSTFTTTAGGLLNDVLLAATVVGGTIATGTGTLTVLGGEFIGVTYQGTLALDGNGGVLSIQNGLTLADGSGPATVLVAGRGAGLDFLDAQDTLSDAVITFSGAAEQLDFQTLTLAQPVDLVASGTVALSGRVLVSASDMTALGSSSTLEINVATFTNDALITVGAGDLLDLENFGFGGPVTVGGTGSISFAAGATLEIGGTATPAQLIAEIGSLVGAQPGVVSRLDGEILNTGTTLSIAATGSFSDVILNALVIGGTIADSGTVSVLGGEFNGVVFQGPALVMPGFETGLGIANGLSIVTATGAPGTLDMTGTSDQLSLLDASPTLDTVTLQVSGLNDQIVAQNGSVTLGANFFGDITGYGLVVAETITTAATIDIAVGAVFQLSANTIFNSGTIFVGQFDTPDTRSSGSSTGGVDKTVFGVGIGLALLGIGDDSQDPFGSYGAAQTFLNFLYHDPDNIVFGADSGLAIGSILQTAQLPAIFASFSTQPDAVILDGSIDNTGATLDITPTGTLSNVILEAIISNGTIVDDGALSFAKTTTLTDVSFVGPALDISTNSNASVVLTNSTVLGAGGAMGTIDVNGAQDSILVDAAATPETLTNLLVNLAMVQGGTGDSFIVDGGTVSLGVDVTVAVGGTASISVYTTGGYYGAVGKAVLTNLGVIDDDGALTIGMSGEPGASFVNAGLISVGAAILPPTGTEPALAVYGSFFNTGTLAAAGPETAIIDSGSFANTGLISLAAGATLDFQIAPAAAGVITMADGAELLRFDDVTPLVATVAGFDGADAIDLTALPFAGTLAVSATLAGAVLDVFAGTTLAAAITLPSFAYTQASLGLQSDGPRGGTEIVTNQAVPSTPPPPPCFLAGTRIRTADGDVAVEDLAAGTMVVTASGAVRPVMWIGQRRVDCRRHPRPELVQPIRVRQDAFADGMPARDLLLSPDHSLFLDAVLVPVHHLLNGATIVREHAASAHYFHVELSAHDVLLAEGLPAESYLDTGNRHGFSNGGAASTLHADFFPTTWENACAPLCQSGPVIAATRAHLMERALAAGYRAAPSAGPMVVAGARTIRASHVAGSLHRFLLPASTGQVRIVSGAGVPASLHDGATDNRQLGVAIAGIVVHGRRLDLDDAAFVSGFYATEDCAGVSRRWTDGCAEIDLPARAFPSVLELRVVDAMDEWRAPERAVAS